MGMFNGATRTSKRRTKPAEAAPISSPYDAHAACGIISPKNSTTVTEMITAVIGSVNRSSTSGSASVATALQTSSVTSNL